MNAIVPVQQFIDAAAWDEATNAVNAWRGHALHCFAQAEAAVSETLLAMASAPQWGPKVRLRRLVGQRFEDLASALETKGPFADERAKAASVLAGFRDHESLRAFLCHGVAKVAFDRSGRWLVVLKLLAFRSREADRSSVVYEKREAEELLADLNKASRQVIGALHSLRRRIALDT
jgi:hypothetical protein